MLATAVVSGPWIALDSSVRGLVAWYVDALPMDAGGMGSESDLANATRDLSAVPNVERVEPLLFFSTESNVTGTYQYYSVLLVRPTYGDIINRLGLAWSAPPVPGGVVVPEDIERLGKGVGDPIPLEWRTPIYDANYTIIGYSSRWANFTISGFYSVVAPERGFGTTSVFLSVDDAPAIRTAANWTSLPAETYIWLDRDALLDPYDLSGSSARLQREFVLLQNAAYRDGFYVHYAGSSRGPGLDGIPGAIDSRTFFLRILYTAFTVPTLALAGLLARVGFEIGVTGRRRELAVLRARGLSVRAVRSVLLLEASLLALFGGLAGLAAGVLASRLFLSSATLGAAITIPLGDVSVSASTVLLALLVAWGFALLASRRLSRLLASEDIVGAFKAHHAAEVSIPHRASRDFLMAGVAAAGILLLIVVSSMRGSPFGLGFFLLGLSTAILAPVAPFLLTAAVVRYLTRGTTRAYRAISRLFRPALGELQPLVERNLARVPRRSSNIAIVVTFAVGFVVAVFILNASYAAYREGDLLRGTPADVVAEYYWHERWPGSPPPLNLLDPANLTLLRSIPGVSSVTPVVFADSDRATMVFFDASSYLRSVRWLTPADLGGADPAALMDGLARGGVFAANADFAGTYGVQPGDPMQFTLLVSTMSLRYLGAVPRIPGLESQWYYPGTLLTYANLSAIPADADLNYTRGGRYLIGLAPDADSAFVAREVREIFQGEVVVRTQAEARAATAADPGTVLVFSFLEVQTEIGVVMLVVAVALFVYSASAERRDELATLVARGVGGRGVGALVMAEGWVVTILGLILGVVGGFVSAWTALTIAGLLVPPGVVVPFVVPAAVLLPMAGAVLGVAAAGFVGASSIRGMDVVRVLKLRGG